jgi:hypothetical protein
MTLPPDTPEDFNQDQATPNVEREHAEPASGDKNWLGMTALVSGALALSVVAIVTGHLGLSAVKNGRATNRTFALAGTILGYIGLAATIAALAVYFLAAAPQVEADARDFDAQTDVINVGSEIANHWQTSTAPPSVTQATDGYLIEDVVVPAQLTTDRTLTFSGTAGTEWCVVLEFEGGNEDAFTYTPTDGLESGDQCEPAPTASPSPSPTPEPSTGPSAEPTS